MSPKRYQMIDGVGFAVEQQEIHRNPLGVDRLVGCQDLGDGLPKDMNVVQVRTVQDAIRAVL